MESNDNVVDPEIRRALSDFYREEFLRHLEHLQSTGLFHEGNRELLHRACTKLMTDLEQVCWRADFPAAAETLLQSFDALTRLSQLEPRQGH